MITGAVGRVIGSVCICVERFRLKLAWHLATWIVWRAYEEAIGPGYRMQQLCEVDWGITRVGSGNGAGTLHEYLLRAECIARRVELIRGQTRSESIW